MGNAFSLGQHIYVSLGGRGLLVSSPCDLNSSVRFSYSYFLTNICPLLNRKHGTHLEYHDVAGTGTLWVLIICYHGFWCYRHKVKYAGRILLLSHSRSRVLYHSPFVKITSVGSRFNETDHSITNGTSLNALYNIAGGKLQIFQSWEGALCICSLPKRKSVFHKIWPCGLKLSFFVPWNSRVWLYISGQLSSTVFQQLTKPVKWAMIRRQHTTLQFTLYPAFASDFGVYLSFFFGGGFSLPGQDFLIWEQRTKQIDAYSCCLWSLLWTALPKKGTSSINTQRYFFFSWDNGISQEVSCTSCCPKREPSL